MTSVDKNIRGLAIRKIDNVNCPIFICQDCDKQVLNNGWGIVLWGEMEFGIVVHKQCPSNRNNDAYPMSEELSGFMLNLNSNINLRKESTSAIECLSGVPMELL